MKIYCINMKEETTRKYLAESKLMPFKGIYQNLEFFHGSKFDELPNEFLSMYREYKSIKNFGRPLMGTEISCFFNHFELWKKCIEINEPILILEDNFGIHKNCDLEEDVITAFEEIKTYHIIKLADNRDMPINFLNLKGNIAHYKRPTLGMTSYIISPYAANKLVEEIKEHGFFDASDVHIERSWMRKIAIYSMIPNTMYRDRSIPSIINKNKRRDKEQSINGFSQKNFRRKNRLIRSIFNFKIKFKKISKLF